MAVGAMGAIIAATVVGFYFFVHEGQVKERQELRGKIAKVSGELETAKKLKADIATLRIETEEIESLVAEFAERLPNDREINVLIAKFESIANQVGLSVDMTPLPTTKDERKETIPYDVAATGDFHQLTNFINKLERYERYVKVSKLKIQEEENGTSEATFVVSTYRFIEQPIQGAAS
jgi:Tfp pilus assembly protein PilO